RRAGDGPCRWSRPGFVAGNRHGRRRLGSSYSGRGGSRRLPYRRTEARDLLRVVRARHQLPLRGSLHDRDRRCEAPGAEAERRARSGDGLRTAPHGSMRAAGVRGMFIVVEGPEGAGKSTRIARLAARLADLGRHPLLTREPGGTPTGDAVREILLDPVREITPLAEFLLYSASRAQLVQDVVIPALQAGHDVICDRYTSASVAYQGYGRGLDLALIDDLNRRVTAGLVPDLTVLLDIEPE